MEQLSIFDVPDSRDGIVFNGENAYNVEQWVRTRKGHASYVMARKLTGIVPQIRVAEGDLTLQIGDTLFHDNGVFYVE